LNTLSLQVVVVEAVQKVTPSMALAVVEQVAIVPRLSVNLLAVGHPLNLNLQLPLKRTVLWLVLAVLVE
jgi:hypothetical protein